MPTSQSKPILLDNTVLSNFSLVKRTDIVLRLWNNCSTPPDAWREDQSGVAIGHRPREAWESLALIELTEAEIELTKQLANALGAGERSCIAVAKSRCGLFFTDDRKARQAALEMGVIVSGTLGILVVAVERKIIPIAEANPLLMQMIQNGYHSPVDNLSSLLS